MLQEMKVYTIDAMSSNSMKSANPNSGIHETQIAKCLDTMCLDPACNQGGCMVLATQEESTPVPKGFRKSSKPRGKDGLGEKWVEDDVVNTLNCFEFGHDTRTPEVVCYALEGNGARPSHMGIGYSDSGVMYTLNTIEQHSVCIISKQFSIAHDVTPSLEATDYKEPIGICYTVDCRNLRTNSEVSGTLQAKENGGFSYNYLNPVLKDNE